MWAGEAAMQKSIPGQAGYASVSDLPRIQKSYREKVLTVMTKCASSIGEQRVQVLISVVQGLSQKQQQYMHQYF